MSPEVTAFFDDATFTISYVVKDPNGSSCAIVDSVLDFDYASGRTDTRSADAVIAYVQENNLTVEWLLESHVHADHLSAAPYLQEKLGGKIGIGDRITVVQDTFGKVFNEGTEFQRDGSQFDQLFQEGDTFHIGQMRGEVMHTPGHTPACLTYVVGDAAFVGDTLFMPDFGTARCDFPGDHRKCCTNPSKKFWRCPTKHAFSWDMIIRRQAATNMHGKQPLANKRPRTFTLARAKAKKNLQPCAMNVMPHLLCPS